MTKMLYKCSNNLFFNELRIKCLNSINLIRCQTKSEAIHNIRHVKKASVNYEEDKNKVPMNKPCNIHNAIICNGIFHISFFKTLLINEGETTQVGRTGFGAKRPGTSCEDITTVTGNHVVYIDSNKNKHLKT